MHIAVTWHNTECFEKAEHLSHTLSLPLSESLQSFDYALNVTPAHLELVSHPRSRFTPFWIDFTNLTLLHRLTKQNPQKEILKKALGIKAGDSPHVLDATAGLGTDAIIMSHLGCTVHLVERSPIIAALLEDGLQRASHHPVLSNTISRMQLSKKDAKDVLLSLAYPDYPDITYVDPMFPSRTKSALNRKEMQLLHTIIEESDDTKELLETALQYTKNRIVVKRPLQAENLSNRIPHHHVQTKQIRYDVYLPIVLQNHGF